MAEAAAAVLFEYFDDNNDGGISYDEMKDAMNSIGAKFTSVQLKAFFNKYDTDHNGILDFNEFVALCISLNSSSESEAAVAKLFQGIDKDGNRSLSHAELREGIAAFTGKAVNDAETEALIKQLDVDGDGEISYEEFSTNYLTKISIAIKNAK